MINLNLSVLKFQYKKTLAYLNFILIHVTSRVTVVKCNWFYVKKKFKHRRLTQSHLAEHTQKNKKQKTADNGTYLHIYIKYDVRNTKDWF